MFSAFSAFISETSEMVSELVQQSAEALQEVAPLDEMVGGTTEDAALTTQLITMKELHDAPPAWEATTEEWLTMMLAALQCTYWCSTTSNTLVGDERSWHGICDVLQLTEEERSTHEALATHLFSPDASLSGYMQEQDGIHRMYSLVVPLVLTSDVFWCSLGWKLGLARCCRKVEQLLLLWRAMSHSEVGADLQQDEKLQERWEEEGGSAEAYWTAVEARWAEQRAHRQWLVEEEARVRKEVDVAMASVELLRNLLTKKEPAHSSLSESVSESCRYHKVKLSRVLAHLCTESERLQGTTLDQHSGALFASTMACSNDLKTVIDAFDARLAGKEELEEELVAELSTSRGPSAELAEDHDAANEAEAEEEEERDAHDADVEAHEDGAPNTRDDDEEEEFSVKLPWADE